MFLYYISIFKITAMNTTDNYWLENETEEDYIDLTKPYDYNKLFYAVVSEGEIKPTKENTLYLPIKGQYFNEIMGGTKDKEYREVKDTTYKKYLWTVDNGDFMLREDFPENTDFSLDFYNNGFFPFIPKSYKYLNIAVGYAKDREWAIVEVMGISFEPAKDKNGNLARFSEDENGEVYANSQGEFAIWNIVYHLGKVIEHHAKGETKSNYSED